MTSEQNLTDEGELQEEEKPRLVINEDVPSSLHHGHKLDMRDRDPIKMNDHVKVKYNLHLFGEYLPWYHAWGFFTQQASACASFVRGGAGSRLGALCDSKVFFQDVFAEPDGSHSIDGVWRASFSTFVATKYWCYRIITAICGVPTAIMCGIYFACLSFDYVWCIMPCLRAYIIELQCLGQLFSLCVRTFFDPFFESVGKIFGGMKLSHENKPFTA